MPYSPSLLISRSFTPFYLERIALVLGVSTHLVSILLAVRVHRVHHAPLCLHEFWRQVRIAVKSNLWVAVAEDLC